MENKDKKRLAAAVQPDYCKFFFIEFMEIPTPSNFSLSNQFHEVQENFIQLNILILISLG